MMILTIGDIKEAIKDRPDNEQIISQVVAQDGTAWIMATIIKPVYGKDKPLVIKMAHPELKTLPSGDEEIERLREENDMILGALIDMCDQYLSRDNKLAHDFMSAGESSLKILEHLGRVTTTDNVYYQWKEQENG